MSPRRPGEGRYAHVEREQRWLVARRPTDARRTARIVDRYLAGTRLRLRRVQSDHGITYKLAQKVRATIDDPEVVKLTNIYLSVAEYEVLAVLLGSELRKTRWHVQSGGRTVAVDEFGGRLEGLLLAEVELDPGEPRWTAPPFAALDVTDDDRFSGGALAFADDGAVRLLLEEVASRTGPAQPFGGSTGEVQ